MVLANKIPVLTDAARAQLFEMAFDRSYEAKIICDRLNRIIVVNEAFTRMTGYAPSDVLGQNPRILSSGKMPAGFYENMWQTLNTKGTWSGELTDRRKDGTTYPKLLTINAIEDGGQIAYYIGSFIDITAIKNADAKLLEIAHRDALTGLLNRHAFDTTLHQNMALALRSGEPLALMCLDMDGFKQINDTLGHAVGDELLRALAKRFTQCVRESDAVARLGGDEFAVMLAPCGVDMAGAKVVAQRLLTAASAPVELEGRMLQLSASIGIALYPDDANSALDLMKHADTEMYEAKGNGKNQFQPFSKRLSERNQARFRLEALMRKSLQTDGDAFFLQFQPQYSLPGRTLIGLEALVRMRGPDGEVIPPSKFIPVAEESTPLISALGNWVIRETCRHLRLWLDAGARMVPVSVNVSAKQITDTGLADYVAAECRRYRVPPSLLSIEVTESAAMQDPKMAAETMKRLHEIGVTLMIDDFGTGYSSLSYLPQLPLDTLKIDRSFIAQLESDKPAAIVASATIALAHNLGLRVVAEGVETEAQAAYLEAARCDAIQGYLLSRPLDPGAVIPLLLNSNGAAPREDVNA